MNDVLITTGEQVTDSFYKIKETPVPYEDLEEGVSDLCFSINQLPFVITTGMSGGNFINKSYEDTISLNHAHFTLAVDDTSSQGSKYINELGNLSHRYDFIEMRKREKNESGGHGYPPIDCNLVYDFSVTNNVSMESVSNKIKIDMAELLSGSEEITHESIDEINNKAWAIPSQDAMIRIKQFNDFSQDIIQLNLLYQE